MGQEMEQMHQMLQNVAKSMEVQESERKNYEAQIKAFDAETKRISAVQAGMTFEQIQDIVQGTIAAALDTGDLIGGAPQREQFEMPQEQMPMPMEQPMMPPEQQIQAMGQEMEQMHQMLQNVAKSMEVQESERKNFEAQIKAFDAETKRISAVQAGMTFEQIQDIVQGTIAAALDTGDLIGGAPQREQFEMPQEQMPQEQMPQPPMPQEQMQPPMEQQL